MVTPDIFRQYDIRGIWGKDVSPGEARANKFVPNLSNAN
jgi:hypothetical protein